MTTAIVTGSGGLIGSSAVELLVTEGFDVVGIENDLRARLFGPDASTRSVTESLLTAYPEFTSLDADVRDAAAVDRLFRARRDVELVVHAAGQPSHDWAVTDPQTDFAVNAGGTLNLLEATRTHAPGATFVFTSTNKVYGDVPNELPLMELERRLDLPADHPYHAGVDTTMRIDRTSHSLFGVSKTAADLLVQEYGRRFELPSVCFRLGCVTGPRHAGAMLHGFLSYLMRCAVTGRPYKVFGYGGKQVRDNIHADDTARAMLAFHRRPVAGAVYNLGGARQSNCSLLEAIAHCEEITGRPMRWTLADEPRYGDHRWWISDLAAFQRDYPEWSLTADVPEILREIHTRNAEAWAANADDGSCRR